MDAGWFWAVPAAIPAIIALIDGHREEAVLGAGMAALAVAGGVLTAPLGLALVALAWAVVLPLVARLNGHADMERRHRLIMCLLKLRVGVSDRALPASLRVGSPIR
ncbi:MAG TPA: hypothetical protein VEA41_22275 [Salinarimonas sp.]|jgi:hypothetical protein|nr:hypothetical protein [Salinarimonas sp.]